MFSGTFLEVHPGSSGGGIWQLGDVNDYDRKKLKLLSRKEKICDSLELIDFQLSTSRSPRYEQHSREENWTWALNVFTEEWILEESQLISL